MLFPYGNALLKFFRFFILCISIAFLSFSFDARSEVALKVASFDTDSSAIRCIIDISIEDGWHIYYKEAGEVGLSTVITFSDNMINPQTHWPQPMDHVDVVLDQKFSSNVYEKHVLFPITSVIDTKQSPEIKIDVEYAVCNEVCIPKTESLVYSVPSESFRDEEVIITFEDWLKK